MKLLNIELKLYTDAIGLHMAGHVYRIIGYHYTAGRAHGLMATY